MKTRAAVAWAAGKPLTIEEVDLEGPKKGEVLVRIVATGVCHTDAFTLSGDDPEGAFPVDLGPRGRRHRRGAGCRSQQRQGGRSRDPALHARMRRVQVLQVRQDQSLPGDPRHAGQGRDARRHEPFLAEGQADPALHGHLDVLRIHGAARDFRRQGRARRRRSRRSACSAAASPRASAPCSTPRR